MAEESKRGRSPPIDYLLILQYLLRYPEVDTALTSYICQRSEDKAREILSERWRSREEGRGEGLIGDCAQNSIAFFWLLVIQKEVDALIKKLQKHEIAVLDRWQV